MASVTLNPLFLSITGRCGDLVFRRRGSRHFISARPRKSQKPPSPAQHAHRRRFAEAVRFAARLDPDAPGLPAYEELAAREETTAKRVAMRDYCHPPIIQRLDLAGYRGQPGDAIAILATDNVGVAQVDVMLRGEDGALLEYGPALLHEGAWIYRCTAPAVTGTRIRIAALARDWAGHAAQSEVEHRVA